MTDLDPAAIMAEHGDNGHSFCEACVTYVDDDGTCLVHRLAAVLAAVLTLHVEWASVEVDDLTRTQAIYKRMGTVLGFTYDEPAEADPYGRSADR